MSEWQPIETAPRDETTILVGNFRDPSWSFLQHVVYWNETDLGTPDHPWCINDTEEGLHKDYPTHWMPLPEPPRP